MQHAAHRTLQPRRHSRGHGQSGPGQFPSHPASGVQVAEVGFANTRGRRMLRPPSRQLLCRIERLFLDAQVVCWPGQLLGCRWACVWKKCLPRCSPTKAGTQAGMQDARALCSVHRRGRVMCVTCWAALALPSLDLMRMKEVSEPPCVTLDSKQRGKNTGHAVRSRV